VCRYMQYTQCHIVPSVLHGWLERFGWREWLYLCMLELNEEGLHEEDCLNVDDHFTNLDEIEYTNVPEMQYSSLCYTYMEYKENDILCKEVSSTMKYSIELVILQNSNISKALYDKIVCWLSYCLDYDAYQHLPNCAKIKRYSMQKLYLEKQECIIPSIGLPICTCEFIP